ncbi:MAG TPA: hypothetical protein GXX19_07590 [Syntrophomonadaceae bacterium]|nr:hypothetical protein [Syntrophomonadaceae bacterium]
MVDWIRLHNKVKESATFQLLSPNQRAAFSFLQKAVRYANRLNLYGESGVGKTFVGWVLARELGALYLPDPSGKMEKAEIIVIDDAPFTRMQSRILYGEALEYANSVILLSREPINDHIVQVQLSLTAEDLAFVAETIRGFGGPLRAVTEPEPGFLWNYFCIQVG